MTYLIFPTKLGCAIYATCFQRHVLYISISFNYSFYRFQARPYLTHILIKACHCFETFTSILASLVLIRNTLFLRVNVKPLHISLDTTDRRPAFQPQTPIDVNVQSQIQKSSSHLHPNRIDRMLILHQGPTRTLLAPMFDRPQSSGAKYQGVNAFLESLISVTSLRNGCSRALQGMCEY